MAGGVGGEGGRCLTRRREGIKEVEIDLFSLSFLRGFATSREVSNFLIRFDDGEEVGAAGGVVPWLLRVRRKR